MKYAIGLDIGIASVGYAVVGLDYEENPWGIIRLGSRIFDVAENPDDGAPLARPRRLARSMRRRLRRHRHRIERIKALLIASKFISSEQLTSLYEGILSDIYELRVKALDKRVDNNELVRILLHLAQRRGFKSNRKADYTDKEKGQLLSAVSENQKRMQDNNYRTVGEMLYKDPLFALNKRNKGGQYITTVHRDMIAEEARLIMTTQKDLGNSLITDEFIEKYLDILLSQRLYDEGPGEPSPYAGNQIEKMVGRCTFEPTKPRAAKASYSFEYFNLLQKVNHLRLIANGETVSLDDGQRKKIIELAHNKADLKYNQIRKELGLSEKVLFNSITYNDSDYEATEKKTKFNYLPAYHKIRKALDKVGKNHIASLSQETLDEIGRILSWFEGDTKRIEAFTKIDLSSAEIDALLTIPRFSKPCHLCLEVLRKIIPYLEQGMIYSDACTAAGYDFRSHNNNEKSMLLPAYKEEMENITSPVARRAISQSIKVINAIIREQGSSPSYINIELAREMAKAFDERNKMKKSMDENQAANERLREELRTNYGRTNPTGLDIMKLKLWKEQDGRSPYSQEALEASRLFEVGYCDIDHIVPYSISFDDTMKNKVLVKASENRDKGNRLPIPYLQAKFGQAAVDRFTVWVNSNVRNYKKKLNLLKLKITVEDINKFKERNLQDTKTISRFLYNYIRDYLLFAPSETGRKKKVTAVNGAITSYLRKRWGINKVRANGDKHHAVDALVIACTTDKMIKDLSMYSEYREMEYTHTDKESILANPLTGEIIQKFPYPWEDFRPELLARLSDDPVAALKKQNLLFYSTMDLNNIKPIFVSRMPRHKVTGAAHEATIRSARNIDQGIVISKKNLTELKLNKDGEIERYYNPESDILLYNAIKNRLLEYGNNGAKAFADTFYKPKADGTPGPIVKKVKIIKKSTLNVAVQQNTAVADNDSMVRVDVFFVPNDGYYLVPIYRPDTLKPILPNKAIVANKSYEEWPEMKDEDFVFSLYSNDLVRFKHKKEVKFAKVNKDSELPDELLTKESIVYYKSANINTGAIGVINNDNTYTVKSLGVKTLQKLEKCQVDILGNISLVKKEKRQFFH